MSKLGLTGLEVHGRRVLARLDYNVPLQGHSVSDDSRLMATVPTLRYLREHQASVVVCAHLGRPKGKPDPRYSLRPVAERLERLLGHSVGFCPETVGPRAREMAARLEPGGVLLVENLRFQPGEEANDAAFARQLAELGEVYVDDAFGAAHRAHASTVGVVAHMPQAAAGFLMERELDYLGQVRAAHTRPFLVLVGGAKASDKLPLLAHLAKSADQLLIGGGMAFTFLRAQGLATGDSLLEPDFVESAARLLAAAGGKILLPQDHVLSDGSVVAQIPAGGKAWDIGPATRASFAQAIARARMLFWNGPMGIFEKPPFDAGTRAVAHAVADCAGTTVVGGGDSVAALRTAGLEDRVSHISTGGGAALEFLAGEELPGVAALTEAAA